MIESFELKNLDTNESVTFGQSYDSNYLFNDGDIDWGSVSVQHNTYSHPGQVGEYISSTEVGSRQISITGYCYYIPRLYEKEGLSIVELLEFCYEKIKKKKTTISRIVNPNSVLKMSIGDYYILGKPASNVVFGKEESDNNKYFCKFLISIYCNNPMFIIKAPVESALRTSKPSFHFPLTFKKNIGYVFGVIYESSVLAIDNFGTVKIGCIITIKSLGVVKNPVLKNLTTGEEIRVNKTLQSGEKIIINTNDSSDRGIIGVIGNEELNYFKYWDFKNDWMFLPVGISVIGFSVEEGNKTDLDINVSIYPSKYELEEM